MSSVKIEALPNGVTRAADEKSAVEFWFPKPNVAIGRYTGTPTAELFGPVNDAMARHLRTERSLHVFADLDAIDGFETAFREAWTAWFRKNRSAVASCHILFRSRLVAIGISMVGAALGGMVQTYSKREDFELALKKAGL
jgi:hypothetical protein